MIAICAPAVPVETALPDELRTVIALAQCSSRRSLLRAIRPCTWAWKLRLVRTSALEAEAMTVLSAPATSSINDIDTSSSINVMPRSSAIRSRARRSALTIGLPGRSETRSGRAERRMGVKSSVIS